MEFTAYKFIPRAQADEIQGWLDSNAPVGGGKDAAVIATYTVQFANGAQADIKVVNSQDGPYVDPVLFDQNGCEIALIEPQYELLGQYQWFVDGITYTAILQQEPSVPT
jgi:hypothetical protein